LPGSGGKFTAEVEHFEANLSSKRIRKIVEFRKSQRAVFTGKLRSLLSALPAVQKAGGFSRHAAVVYSMDE